MFFRISGQYIFATKINNHLKREIMKQLLRKCLLLVVLLTTIETYSNPMTILANGEIIDGTKVTFENVQKGSLLQIKDGDGVILYKEVIEKTGTYSKGFDFTNLPMEKYFLELETQKEITIIPLYIKANAVEIMKDEEFIIIKPDVIARDELVYISNDSLNNQEVKIDVFYEGFDLAYSEKIKNVPSLKRTYDFSTSKKGNYIIVFNTQGRSFTNNVTIP